MLLKVLNHSCGMLKENSVKPTLLSPKLNKNLLRTPSMMKLIDSLELLRQLGKKHSRRKVILRRHKHTTMLSMQRSKSFKMLEMLISKQSSKNYSLPELQHSKRKRMHTTKPRQQRITGIPERLSLKMPRPQLMLLGTAETKTKMVNRRTMILKLQRMTLTKH